MGKRVIENVWMVADEDPKARLYDVDFKVGQHGTLIPQFESSRTSQTSAATLKLETFLV